MKYLLFLIFLPFTTYSQKYYGFNWENHWVNFNTVQMKVLNGITQKVIFNGYKDATIRIECSEFANSPTDAKITAKLSGYYELEGASVNSFEYTVKDNQTIISYTAIENQKMLYIKIFYDEIEKKATELYISTLINFLDKKEQPLVFILKGFE